MTGSATLIITTSSAVAVLSSAIVTNSLTAWSSRKEQYKRILDATGSLTTGEVAQARHSLGTIFEDNDSVVELTQGQVKEYYDVLWAFDRIYGIYRSLRPIISWQDGWTRPQQLL